MLRIAVQSHRWVFPLAAGLLFGAVFLRSVLTYQDSPGLWPVMILLFVWLVLGVSEYIIYQRVRWYFPIYLVIQMTMVFILLTMPNSPDFFATLLLILSMQVMLRLDARVGALWISLCAVTMTLIMLNAYGSQAIALSLVYTAGSVLLGFFTLATRRADDARIKAETLARQLQEANDKLQSYSFQLRELSASREKNRLARDLHDSVTQTVFSMSLTAQSAGLLFDRDHNRLRTQLEHLSQLSRSALAELSLIISELRPSGAIEGGLVSTLRKHIAGRRFPEHLSISLQGEGDGVLSSEEEQGLFRIVQEALNNIVKHARTSQAGIHIHIDEPYWIEIVDQGQGFDLQQALAGSIGLNSMYERAAEIGWNLQINTSPGEGARIRLEKK